MYFAFTTLATVGFGDYVPRSNGERATGAFILISGVAMFSYLMGNFIQILKTYQNLNADCSDGETLTYFFGILKHFNDNTHLEYGLKKSIEDHLDYLWNNDRNMALIDESEMRLFLTLPISVQNSLYLDFLYTDFIDLFQHSYFKFQKNLSSKQLQFYSWDDQIYRQMMIDILSKLEPRKEPAFSVIFQTIEEVQEIFFIMKGSIEIGFEVSRKPKYVLRLTRGGVIGIFNVTFNRKTMFSYRVRHEFEGYTIRKDNWKQIINNEEYELITNQMRRTIKEQFNNQIKHKVLQIYRKYIFKLRQRKDRGEILAVLDIHSNEHMLMNIETPREVHEHLHTENDETCHGCTSNLDDLISEVDKLIQYHQILHAGSLDLRQRILEAQTQLK